MSATVQAFQKQAFVLFTTEYGCCLRFMTITSIPGSSGEFLTSRNLKNSLLTVDDTEIYTSKVLSKSDLLSHGANDKQMLAHEVIYSISQGWETCTQALTFSITMHVLLPHYGVIFHS